MGIKEPTHREFRLLCEVQDNGPLYRVGGEEDIDIIYELVRNGYLNNLVLMGHPKYEWKFVITEQGEEYLENSKL